MTKILLVEDDKSIVANLTEFLESEGFRVKSEPGQKGALGLLEGGLRPGAAGYIFGGR